MRNKKRIRLVSAIILLLFALLTLFMSSSVIFDWFGIRAKEGNYVLFIVLANFGASIIYLMAVYGFVKNIKWTFQALLLALLILVLAFIGLLFHINSGGIYETKTVMAMLFRMLVTLIFALIAYFNIKEPS